MSSNSIVRPIATGDADLYQIFINQLDRETKFMLFEPGERSVETEFYRKMIETSLTDPNVGWFVAQRGYRIVGFLSASRAQQNRVRHRAALAMGILEDSRRMGLASKLFELLFTWANQNGIERLELTVVTTNAPAIALYERMGFQVEGQKQRSLLVDGAWANEYLMAKLLKP